MCAGVEHVGARSVFVKHADVFERPEHAHECCCAVDHCGVDHLALAAFLCFKQCTHHAVGKEHAAAAKVAHHVEWWNRCFACASKVSKRASKGNVINVVAGKRCIRAFLTPTRHATKHQLGVALRAFGWANAQAFHHTRAETFNECVGFFDQLQQRFNTLWVL